MNKLYKYQEECINALSNADEIRKIAEKTDSIERLMLLDTAISSGIDYHKFLDWNITDKKLCALITLYKENINLEDYDVEGMYEGWLFEIAIRTMKGLDTTLYKKLEVTPSMAEEYRIMLGLEIDEEYLQQFDTIQMYAIFYSKMKGFDLLEYVDNNFNFMQMREVYTGLEYGVDVSLYADSSISAKAMYEIKIGLVQDVNTCIYSDDRIYSPEQMGVLRDALASDIDVSSIVNPQLSVESMSILVSMMDTEGDCAYYDEENEEEYPYNMDWDILALPAFNVYQLNVIWYAMMNGIYVEAIIDPDLTAEQMEDMLY